MKKFILGMIAGILLCSSAVYAASYYAKDVKYEPTDSSWDVSNVHDALNDLYTTRKGSKLELPYYVYPGSQGYYTAYYSTSTTFDVSNGMTGVLGKFNLNGVSGMALDISSYHSSYTGTIYICVCEELPKSLD